jgi:hypothetical protein
MGKSRSQVLRKLLKLFNGQCAYCQRPCLEDGGWGTPTLDHSTPRTRGGPRFGPNAVLSCAACNHLKGDMTAFEFKHFLAMGELHPNYTFYLTERLKDRAAAHGIHIRFTPDEVTPNDHSTQARVHPRVDGARHDDY